MKYTAIKDRASKYQAMLDQVMKYRESWGPEIRIFILEIAQKILEETGVSAQIEVEEKFENLESITISLGKSISGIAENVDEMTKRTIIKDKGALIYSQLFNGKVQAWMTYPIIEGLMQPKQPKMLGIYGPPEIDEDLILNNFDNFFKELMEWENYDDDQPGQPMTKIGFGTHQEIEEDINS